MIPKMRLFILSVVLTIHGWAAAAQSLDDLRDAVRDAVETENSVAVFQAISIFGASPGISGASYTFKDDDPDASTTDINVIKLPIAMDLKPPEQCAAAVRNTSDEVPDEDADDPAWHCVKPYVELSLSYVNAEEQFNIPDIGDVAVDFDLDIFSALAGAGFSIPLQKGTVFRPIFLLGYSHIADDTDISGDDGAVVAALVDGIALNIEIDSLLIGAAAELQHQHRIASNTDLDATIRYNHVISEVVSASDEALEKSNDFGILTAEAEINRKIGWEVFSRDVHAVGSLGGSFLLGEQGRQFDTDFYTEFGAGVEIKDDSLVQGVEGLQLFGRYILGPDVTGYKIGAKLTF
jgi:hypothetical protein